MCETDDFGGFANAPKPRGVTRRTFGKLAFGAGLVAALPRVTLGADTQGGDLDIKTPAGTADDGVNSMSYPNSERPPRSLR